MHEVPYALGIIDSNNLNQIASLEQICTYDQTHDPKKGQESCKFIMNYIKGVSGDVLNYNVRDFGYDWAAIEDPYVDMLTISGKTAQLYKAIHISGSKKKPIFNSGSDGVTEGYKADNLVDYSKYYNYLLEINYPFVVMAGEFDMQDGIASQYRWMKELLKVSQEFWKQDRKVYYY